MIPNNTMRKMALRCKSHSKVSNREHQKNHSAMIIVSHTQIRIKNEIKIIRNMFEFLMAGILVSINVMQKMCLIQNVIRILILILTLTIIMRNFLIGKNFNGQNRIIEAQIFNVDSTETIPARALSLVPLPSHVQLFSINSVPGNLITERMFSACETSCYAT